MKNIARKSSVEDHYQPLCSVKNTRTGLQECSPVLVAAANDAEERALISPGVTTLMEPTSGNLGIGLVFIAVQKGYRFIAVMPAKYSLDKQMLLRFLGAELILTNPAVGFKGMNDKVEELMKTIPNSHCLNQVSNPANPEAHFRWTGPEIWKDTAGKVDIFVSSVGSGGTLIGVGRYLKMKNPSVKIVCLEPSENAVISGGAPGPHKIQGRGACFIPEVLDTSVIDEVVTVSTEEAGDGEEAGEECRRLPEGRAETKAKMIVTMFPSSGEGHMNSDLFADVRKECSDMTF